MAGAFDRLAGERRCVAADFLGLGFTRVAAGQSVRRARRSRCWRRCSTRCRSPGRPHRQRQRRRGGAAVRPALSAAGPHDAADQLRRRAGQPAAGAAAGAGCCPRGEVRRDMDRAVGREHGAGSHERRLRRPDVHVSGESHRRGDQPVPRAAGELPGKQGAGRCLRAGARPESARRHRGVAQAVHGADAHPLGHGRQHLLAGEPGLSGSQLPNSRGVRRFPGAKLFWPEEFPDVIAEEARKLWA